MHHIGLSAKAHEARSQGAPAHGIPSQGCTYVVNQRMGALSQGVDVGVGGRAERSSRARSYDRAERGATTQPSEER